MVGAFASTTKTNSRIATAANGENAPMKKIMMLGLAVVIAAGIVGCGTQEEENATAPVGTKIIPPSDNDAGTMENKESGMNENTEGSGKDMSKTDGHSDAGGATNDAAKSETPAGGM